MSPKALIGYARDAGCVVVGLGGIVFQILTGTETWLGMSTCMVLLGYAGAVNVQQLLPPSSPRGGRGSSSSARHSGSPSPSAPTSEAET